MAEATARAKDLEFDKKQKIVFDREITNLSVADLYAKARQNRDYASLGANSKEKCVRCSNQPSR